MKYNVGDKFVIEIGEVYSNGSPFAGDNEPCTLYRIKGFNSLVFDENCLSKLKKLEKAEVSVDWSKVAVDTPILVKGCESEEWINRYFAKYENGEVYTFQCGATSWSSDGTFTAWEYAKLAESEG